MKQQLTRIASKGGKMYYRYYIISVYNYARKDILIHLVGKNRVCNEIFNEIYEKNAIRYF